MPLKNVFEYIGDWLREYWLCYFFPLKILYMVIKFPKQMDPPLLGIESTSFPKSFDIVWLWLAWHSLNVIIIYNKQEDCPLLAGH